MATERSSYVNNLNGVEYLLPPTFTGSFREDPYTDGSEGLDPTRSNARIRALAYVWMKQAGVTFTTPAGPSSGPFIKDAADDADLSLAMRLDDVEGNIAVFSDCGYASEASGQAGGELCDDEADAANPWDFFTDAFGDNIKTYFTPSATNDSYLPEGYNSLDLWQADADTITNAAANVVIVSDIVQLCAPTQYNENNGQLFPAYSPDYINVSKVFENLSNLTKAGGLLIFSVPYDGDPLNEVGTAVEAIPDVAGSEGCGLWTWTYDVEGDNSVIKNTSEGGVVQDSEVLNFTGGINCPAILRTFTRGAVYQYLSDANFQDITFHVITDEMNDIGIFWDATINGDGKWVAKNSDIIEQPEAPASKSLIVTARKP